MEEAAAAALGQRSFGPQARRTGYWPKTLHVPVEDGKRLPLIILQYVGGGGAWCFTQRTKPVAFVHAWAVPTSPAIGS